MCLPQHQSKLRELNLGPAASSGLRLNRLVASVAPLPADEVGDEDDEDQSRQGAAHGDGDQHVVLIQLALFHCGDKQAPTVLEWACGPYKEASPSSLPLPSRGRLYGGGGRRGGIPINYHWRSFYKGGPFCTTMEIMASAQSRAPGPCWTLNSPDTQHFHIPISQGEEPHYFLKQPAQM